ncbi:DNA-repair protein XRCC1 [Solanum stenotomum]|uniref:DNA-repair protein XRCC1 n=1 Tax=Solanum stenotomum TaxID=172797 RepID=UPI0020D18334|nr:DNA-repair protein XRCC1 [Solanum stenotomum]
MSGSNDGDKNGRKRNLPSWMSSKPGSSGSGQSKSNDEGETTETAEQGKGRRKTNHSKTLPDEAENEAHFSNFSKLMEGVVFVLSGFVNPERGTLRSQALEMGAKYQPDWNSESTLLICAFSNTPKFRQVEADNGTIVSKEWITECYKQRKLVEIETYLMHAGKPWKRQSVSHESSQDQKTSTSRKSQTRGEKSSPFKTTTTPSSEEVHSDKVKDGFSPYKVKKWAIDDLNRTISWLENQDERPEPHEMKKIAAEGILTCLQDAIDSLNQGQDMRQITEQWECIPRAVEELAKFDGSCVGSATMHKDLCKQAATCKQIYELEYRNREDDELSKRKEQQTRVSGKAGGAAKDAAAYDSDDTVEMTEEEINHAYNAVASTVRNTKRV